MPRPYDLRAWRRLQRLELQTNPLCETCGRAGRLVPAVLVDHIKAISDGGAILPSLEELMSMCQASHNQKHGKRGIKFGCDANGMPLDPSHPFFADIHTPTRD